MPPTADCLSSRNAQPRGQPSPESVSTPALGKIISKSERFVANFPWFLVTFLHSIYEPILC